MQTTRRHAPALAALTLAAAPLLLAQAAHAQTGLTWTGSGASGTDPYGQGWKDGFSTSASAYSWGTPGIGAGNLAWAGPDTLSEFDITFTGLPAGVSIAPLNNILFDGTRFQNADAAGGTGVFWTGTLTGTNSVMFTAPSGAALSHGTFFFVNAAFTGDAKGSAFVVHYNGGTPAAATVPEPGTWAAFAFTSLGTAALLLRARKRTANPA